MENNDNKIGNRTNANYLLTELALKKFKMICTFTTMLLVAGVVIVSLLRDRIVTPSQWTVTVTGRGEVAYRPDIALVTLGVRIDKAKKAEDALTQLTKTIDAVMEVLQQKDIEEQDIQTQNYALTPQYETVDGRSTLVGYSANQQITVKLMNADGNMKETGTVVEAATKAGANEVTGVTFDISNLEELKQEARIQALNDARQKSAELAKTADLKLRKIVGWWENFVQLPPQSSPAYYYSERGGGGDGSSVPSGEEKIIVEMGVNYLVK